MKKWLRDFKIEDSVCVRIACSKSEDLTLVGSGIVNASWEVGCLSDRCGVGDCLPHSCK
jgi:hypothetical protein